MTTETSAAFAGPAGSADAVPQPVPDRPLTLMDILDGAFNVVRARPRDVALILAVFVLPAQLITAWALRDLYAFDFTDFDTQTGEFADQEELESLTGPSAILGPATFVSLLVLPFIGVALTHLVGGWIEGLNRSGRECVAFALRRTPTILAAFVLGKLVQIFTLSLGTPFTILIAPVIASEGLGPIRAVRRSMQLASQRVGPMILFTIAIAFVTNLLGNALGLIPTLLGFLFGDWGWVAFFGLGLISQSIINAFAVGAVVVAYFDLRNRTEGLDLQRRLDRLQAFPAR